MENIKASKAAEAEEKALDKNVKETKVLGDGKLVTTLQTLREAGVVSPNDRRIALAEKGGVGGRVQNDVVNAPAIPVEKDKAQVAEITKAVEAADKDAGVYADANTDTPKQAAAKARLHSK